MSIASNPFIAAVKQHADFMLAHGRGIVDGQPCPLFGGVVDPKRKCVVTAFSPPPPGIRIGDFNWCGNNLLHDLPFLESLLALTQATGESQYAQAVDDMAAFYLPRCPDPETGLFPWGEHAQWSFSDKDVLPCSFTDGLKHHLVDRYLIHEHHHFIGAWFWERMYAQDPAAVQKFCRGLDNHIVNPETFEHNRHAPMNGRGWRDRQNPDTVGPGKDFARHSGFYIFDCLFTYAKTGDTALLDWARRKTRYHLDRRLPNGIIRGCVRSKGYDSEGQHDSFSLCLSDAAHYLGDTSVGREFAAYAQDLFASRKNAAAPIPAPQGPTDAGIWVEGYFRKASIDIPRGNTCVDMYLRTGQQSYADTLLATADWLSDHLPAPPPGVPVLARRFQHLIDTALGAHQLSGDSKHLATAEKIAHWAIADLFRANLFMGVSNLKLMWFTGNGEYHMDPWTTPNTPGMYYSCTGTPSLLRTILRLGLIQEGQDNLLGVDSYHRP